MGAPFVLFGPDHLLALALVAAGSLLAFRAGQGRWAGTVATVGGGAFALLAAILWLARLEDGFQAYLDLPLWLCDIAFLLCVACFFRPNELMLTLLAYWGLAGTLQALITPDVLSGFPSKEFLLFFTGHSVIVVGVFFLVGKSRPPRLATARGVATAFAGLLVYSVVVGGLDALFGWNYGYLRGKPEGASVLDSMGAWPYYIANALILALVLFVVVAGLLRLLWKLSDGAESQQ